MRFATVALFALAGCTSLPPEATPPPAPTSSIKIVTSTDTIDASFDAQMVRGVSCPGAAGLGPRAGDEAAAVTALFSLWPEDGALIDLSEPGASDLVIVAADVGKGTWCTGRVASQGYVDVRRFNRVGDRFLVDVVLQNVVAGDALINAHLYH